MEAWRVPLSGAIGESEMCELPDRVRRYLIGDVAVSINSQDTPIEVKFRSNAEGFTSVYRYPLLSGSSEGIHNRSKTVRKASSAGGDIQCIQYADCMLVIGVDAFIEYTSGVVKPQITNTNTNLLNTTLTNWLDKCKVLALRSKRAREWYFILI